MTQTKQTGQVLTPPFRVSYPNVFKPRAAEAGEKEKYSISMIFPKTTNLAVLKEEWKRVAVEHFGADPAKWPKHPFRDGAEKPQEGYGKDVIFVSAGSEYQPAVVDQKVQPILNPKEFYPGCWAQARVNAFFWTWKSRKGVSFGLGNIQKVRDDEPLGNLRRPEDDFAAIPMPDTGAGSEGAPMTGGAPAGNSNPDPLGGIGA